MEKEPKVSIFFTSFMNNLALFNGFYWVKLRNLGDFFKQFNGREFSKQLKDMEIIHDRIKPPKDLQDDFPEILEESNKIREDITHYIENINRSNIKLDEFEYLYNYIVRFRKLEDKIHLIKKNFQEAENFKKEIEKLKEIYYNMMDDYLRNIVDHHFKNFNFNNLIEFENINFYSFIFNQFENFLFKVFKFVLMQRPEIIKKKSIDLNQLDMILDNLKIDIINEVVIEDTLHHLFYSNYKEIIKYANKPLGLNIKIDDKDISILNGYKQIKNLYSHGEGIVNTLLMKKLQTFNIKFNDLGLSKSSLGDKLQINIKLIKELENLLFKVSSILDKSLVSKYPEIIGNP